MFKKCIGLVRPWQWRFLERENNIFMNQIATGQLFYPDSPASSTNKTDSHDITEILLKVALSTTKQTNKT
jgi:hypothetical protein